MKRPNVIIAICHDLGQHLGCYGVETVRSPNVDGLAEEGVRFENSFCTAPQCSPSRAALMTGRYPHANGVLGLSHAPFFFELPDSEKHIAAIMRDAGYRTVLSGVQHVTNRPLSLGFDEDLSLPRRTAAEVTSAFLGWLDGNAVGEKPFFAQVGYFEPHRPFDYGEVGPDDEKGVWVPPYLKDCEATRAELALYQGAVRRMDENFGRILAALDEKGIAEDTLVIFTVDHGIPFPRAKCTLYDPGLEVALIMRWPKGGVKGGKVFDETISNVDVLPTVLDLLDIEAPDNLHGRSFAPLLRGEVYEPNDAIFAEKTFHSDYDPIRCIRTSKWKFIANLERGHSYEIPTDIWQGGTFASMAGEIDRGRRDFELYDLENDPNETRNLSGKPELADIERELRARLFNRLSETGDPLLHGHPASPTWRRVVAALRGE